MTDEPTEKLWTAKACARYLDVTVDGLDYIISKNPDFPFVRLGNPVTGRRRFYRADIDAWLHARRGRPNSRGALR